MNKLSLLVLLIGIAKAHSADYVPVGSVNGGAGHSAKSAYSLVGRVHALAGSSSAKAYVRTVVTPGSTLAPSMPSTPTLALELVGGDLVISWPTPADGFTLEETSSLQAPVQWTKSTSQATTTTSQTISVNLGQPLGTRIFRLQRAP